jgi:hypothetical protein
MSGCVDREEEEGVGDSEDRKVTYCSWLKMV